MQAEHGHGLQQQDDGEQADPAYGHHRYAAHDAGPLLGHFLLQDLQMSGGQSASHMQQPAGWPGTGWFAFAVFGFLIIYHGSGR